MGWYERGCGGWVAIVGLLAGLMGVGCGSGDGRVAVQPTRGRVTREGRPLPGALVTFHPNDPASKGTRAGRPAGETGADGGFSLSTYDADDGAPAGEYRVTVSPEAVEDPDEEGTEPTDPAVRAKGARRASERASARFYLNPETTPLKATIREGENRVDLEVEVKRKGAG